MTGKSAPENLFDDFGEEYDHMIAWEARLKREEPFFRELFDRYNVGSVLDAACGTGHHALLFAGWGLTVTGADLSPTMVERARVVAAEHGLAADFVQAGFGGLAAAIGGEFDAVVCLGNSLPHVRNTGDLQAALADFHRMLRPGGVLVVQNRNYAKVLTEKSRFMPLNQFKDGAEETLYLRITDFPENQQPGLITFNIVALHKDPAGKWSYRVRTEQLKPWLGEELTPALGAAGFNNISYFGDYSGRAYEPEASADLIMVAAKVKVNGGMKCMEWSKEALSELEKVPRFVRGMAKSAVEKAAREKGMTAVTPEVVQETKEKYFSLIGKEKEGDKKTTKIAVVRCDTVSEVCPGVGCLKAFNHRKLHFADYGPDTELIGFFTCGGCSGRRVSRLVEKLLDHDLDVVHLSSCMLMDGDYPKCPFKNQIKRTIEQKGVKVVEGTHH